MLMNPSGNPLEAAVEEKRRVEVEVDGWKVVNADPDRIEQDSKRVLSDDSFMVVSNDKLVRHYQVLVNGFIQ